MDGPQGRISLENATLGLVGELAEFVAAVEGSDLDLVKEEAGDVLWYACAIATLADSGRVPPKDFDASTVVNTTKAFFMHAGALCEHVKKSCRHGKTIDLQLVQDNLYAICVVVSSVLDAVGLDFDAALSANMDKLRRRYPNGFDNTGGNR